MFLGNTKCKDDRRSDFVKLPMRNIEEKETKFDHYNFTGLTEHNIQSNFHSVLEICRMRMPRVFKSRCAQR